MAEEQLAGVRSREHKSDPSSLATAGPTVPLAGGGGVGGSAGGQPPVDIRVQERVRADLMLTVLYDMLGQYEESDGYLAAALNVSVRVLGCYSAIVRYLIDMRGFFVCFFRGYSIVPPLVSSWDHGGLPHGSVDLRRIDQSQSINHHI